MIMNDLVTQQLEEGLLTLTFNRPNKLNAFNAQMYRLLAAFLQDAQSNPKIEVVLLTGGSTCFTAGNDLHDFLESPPENRDHPVFQMMRALVALEKPVIAAVNGPAIGIGTTLLLHCDQVLVSSGAKFRLPFAALGLCPEFASSLLLPRVLGHARASRLLMANEAFAAEQAVQWGLANELLADGATCIEAAGQLARQMQRMPQHALRLTKHLLKVNDRALIDSVLEHESAHFIKQLQTPEAKAALRKLLGH